MNKTEMNTPRRLYVWSTGPKIPPDLLQKDLLTLDYIGEPTQVRNKNIFQEKETEDKVTETQHKNLNPLFFSPISVLTLKPSAFIYKKTFQCIDKHTYTNSPTTSDYKKYNYLLTHQKKLQHH